MTNRRHGRSRVPLVALVCLLQLSAAAQDALVERVRWQAPAGCPTRADVEQLLVRLDSAAWLELDGAIQRTGQGYRLRLRVRGQGRSFERELRAQTCDVLAESTVWLVELAALQLSAAARAVPAEGSLSGAGSGQSGESTPAGSRESADLVDPVAAASGEAAAADPSLAEESSATDPQANPVVDTSYLSAGPPKTTHDAARAGSAAVSGEDDARGLHVRLGIGAAAADVGLSGLSPHLALDLMLVYAHWTLGVRLGALLHPELNVAGGARVDLQTNAAQLLGCRLWDVAGLSIGPCLALSALHTAARTSGLTGSDSSSASWLAAGPNIVLHARLTSALRLSGELGAWATLTPRPSFEVSGTSVARAGTLAGYARLGASYELW